MSKEPNRNVYVGHRYVPKIMGEWNQSNDYEGLSIVTYQGASYTSKKRVPVGIDILNEEFWVVTGNYNAQVEYYRDETSKVKDDMSTLETNVSNDLRENKDYVDNSVSTLKTDVSNDLTDNKNYVDNTVNSVKAVDNFSNVGLTQAVKPLNVESYIGNNLTTHPSIIDFGNSNRWNGYRYWLAHTPYPGTFNENPSIAVSNDNINFKLPTAETKNPLVDTPPGDAYYSDTELVFDSEKNVLRMFYREANTPDGFVNIWYIESSNGSDWTEPAISYTDSERNILSPSIFKDLNGKWLMYFVENDQYLGIMESTDGINWSNLQLLTQPFENWSLWHIGVTQTSDGTTHILGSTDNKNDEMRPILYAYSLPGQRTLHGVETPQLIPSGYFGGYLYRPTFTIDETKEKINGMPYVKMWYGGANDSIASGFYLGYTEGYLMNTENNNSSLTNENIKRKRIGDFFKTLTGHLITPLATISRLITKRVVIKSDYSQPLMEFFDGRKGRDGKNNLRVEYQGGNDEEIRTFLTYTNNNGEYKRITIAPYLNSLDLNKMSLHNVKDIAVEQAVISNGIRLNNGDEYTRIVRDASGNTVFQLGAHSPKLRNNDGHFDMDGGGIFNAQFFSLSGKNSETNALNGTLFEDEDGLLKYKNQNGVVSVLTSL